jgi:hypothetical protein
MHRNNINSNALDLCEEEKKNERNGDSMKTKGVCRPLRELGQTHGVGLARPTPWVISLRRRLPIVRVIKYLMG